MPANQPTTHRDANGRLTRAGMEHAIKSGGGVLHNGEVITSLSQLPDEVTLARGDAARLEAHLEDLDRQQAALALQRQRAERALHGAGAAPALAPEPEAAPPVPETPEAVRARLEELDRRHEAMRAERDRHLATLERLEAAKAEAPHEDAPAAGEGDASPGPAGPPDDAAAPGGVPVAEPTASTPDVAPALEQQPQTEEEEQPRGRRRR